MVLCHFPHYSETQLGVIGTDNKSYEVVKFALFKVIFICKIWQLVPTQQKQAMKKSKHAFSCLLINIKFNYSQNGYRKKKIKNVP